MSDFKKLLKEHSYLNRFQMFQNLMSYRVREILLVSSLYDSFILEEEGQLFDMIQSQYSALNLSQAPSLTRVSNAREALKITADGRRFDLIITTPNISDMSASDFAQQVLSQGHSIPVVLLTYDNRELADLTAHYDMSVFEKVFIWQGDHRILVSIVKYIEDKMNIDQDTKTAGVQSIILIEDNVFFYSAYLPIIYTELVKHSQSLISEGINISHKILRMRARPKILLCSTYEEAWDYYRRHENCIIGVISDIEFPRQGKMDSEAGIEFARQVKKSHFDIPVLLQSDCEDCREIAEEMEVSFLMKTSSKLLKNLKEFMRHNMSFGEFVFRMPDGEEVGRAEDLKSLERKLHTIPDESLLYHAERNHFSNWFKARTEFWLAHSLRPKKITDYDSADSMRRHLITSLQDFRKQQFLGSISDFDPQTFDTASGFSRIGSGSLGGKARGLGFANTLINSFKISNKYNDISVFVPPSVVLATDMFDQFVEDNNLHDFATNEADDAVIMERFLQAPLSDEVVKHLKAFLHMIRYPLAVRSSSLLEDSRYLPFAGIYATEMLPNSHSDPKVRLMELMDAIRRVYASTYGRHAKNYLISTPYRLEEEKMAVVIQKLIGSKYGDRFYPTISGVVRSHNFYPLPPMTPSDGVASVGLGLGRTVVEGGETVRFCPRYPKHLSQFSSVNDTLDYSQKNFWAVKLESPDDASDHSRVMELHQYDLSIAEKDGSLAAVGSTYSPENDNIVTGISRPGTRLVTLAPILKDSLIPLPQILDLVSDMGTWGMNSPVEIEFAVNMATPPGTPKEFAFLQLRPMVRHHEMGELEVDQIPTKSLICRSPQVLGNGIIDELYDIVVVDQSKYERSMSREVAQEISQLNAELLAKKVPYLLIGVGRWGSADPWLGIPVTWDEISGARAIVETSFKDFKVTPSQGTHFFQNITSFRMGYFTVNESGEDNFVDWKWLARQKEISKKKFTRHLQFKKPIAIKMNGHSNKGIIFKPGKAEDL
ncbi:MAG: PEP/pyruvate-binding domain-containing protein [bacterium]|nr:PEP/pyruvate-binding domain-containing protein [bacterium]